MKSPRMVPNLIELKSFHLIHWVSDRKWNIQSTIFRRVLKMITSRYESFEYVCALPFLWIIKMHERLREGVVRLAFWSLKQSLGGLIVTKRGGKRIKNEGKVKLSKQNRVTEIKNFFRRHKTQNSDFITSSSQPLTKPIAKEMKFGTMKSHWMEN